MVNSCWFFINWKKNAVNSCWFFLSFGKNADKICFFDYFGIKFNKQRIGINFHFNFTLQIFLTSLSINVQFSQSFKIWQNLLNLIHNYTTPWKIHSFQYPLQIGTTSAFNSFKQLKNVDMSSTTRKWSVATAFRAANAKFSTNSAIWTGIEQGIRG